MDKKKETHMTAASRFPYLWVGFIALLVLLVILLGVYLPSNFITIDDDHRHPTALPTMLPDRH